MIFIKKALETEKLSSTQGFTSSTVTNFLC